MTHETIYIFTDGSCSPNPGPGGWAALLRYGSKEHVLSGAQWDTTNNQMELTAAIQALAYLKKPGTVILTTDSQYMRQGITSWIVSWKKNQWRTCSGAPVKNQSLWIQLDRVIQPHQIDWRWVKAHDGHEENERVDRIASDARKSLTSGNS